MRVDVVGMAETDSLNRVKPGGEHLSLDLGLSMDDRFVTFYDVRRPEGASCLPNIMIQRRARPGRTGREPNWIKDVKNRDRYLIRE
ncbi:hypothetical protein QF000_000559 [Paraburkholderia atlantica]